MAAICAGGGHTILSFVNTSVAFTFKDGALHEQLLEHDHLNTMEDADTIDASMLICSAVSNRCEYFTCCIHKDLFLWKIKDWKLLSRRLTHRSASAITFSPKDDKIVVADKSGDVFLFSVENPEKEGELILGHVSMLLDVLISPDSKYILTSDRDEKIRVSCFPNSYNIQSYCLGHEEFVTCLGIVPHNETILASGSGDGTIRFWDYVLGKQLLHYYCNESNLELSKDNTSPVISKLSFVKQEENISIMVVQLISFKGILVYSLISSGMNKCELICSFKQKILLESEPWCFCLNGDNLWILIQNLDDCMLPYIYCRDKNEFILDQSLVSIKSLIRKHITNVEDVFKKEKHINTLYKRRFDNVQEYLKRKMDRIETNTKKLKNLTTSDVT